MGAVYGSEKLIGCEPIDLWAHFVCCPNMAAPNSGGHRVVPNTAAPKCGRYRVVPAQRGVFDWGLNFHWSLGNTAAELGNAAAMDGARPAIAARSARSAGAARPGGDRGAHLPVRTPVHAGGLFTISRSRFGEIGRYDVGMETWGFENVELSFRTWMCDPTRSQTIPHDPRRSHMIPHDPRRSHMIPHDPTRSHMIPHDLT